MLHDLVGHEERTGGLARAQAAGTLPTCVLLHGGPGVGKQRLALWLAQLRLCEAPAATGPCGSCKPCRLTLALEHPDLHWYFPLPRPKSASNPEKLREALEVARHERLNEIREHPLQPSVPSEDPTGLYLAVAQSLRARAQKRPSMGAHQVFVIGEAETLVPQEASQEAANALLKLLEEPPAGTTLVLTSNQPGRLLDTIRSRTLPLYVPPLPDETVEAFLRDVAGFAPAEATRAAALAAGSIGRALGFVTADGEKGRLEEHRRSAFYLLRAALAGSRGPGYRHALQTRPARARGLLPLLEAVEVALRDLAAVAAEAPGRAMSADAADFLEKAVRNHRIHPAFVAEALASVEEAKEMAAGNVNPQLILSGLVLDLRTHLVRSMAGTP